MILFEFDDYTHLYSTHFSWLEAIDRLYLCMSFYFVIEMYDVKIVWS